MLKFLLFLCILFVTRTYSQEISASNLKIGTRYWSPNRNYFVEFKSDGNLVVYNSAEKLIWDTKTNGKGARSCEMQGDGNLVLYNGDTLIWNSETYGHSGVKSQLQMQDDGNLVIVACINCYWIPLWSWQTGKWTTEQINNFPESHPNGAKCCTTPLSQLRIILEGYCGMYNHGQNAILVNNLSTVKTVTIATLAPGPKGMAIASYNTYTINPGQRIPLGCTVLNYSTIWGSAREYKITEIK